MEGKPKYSIWTAFGEGLGAGTGSLAQPRELSALVRAERQRLRAEPSLRSMNRIEF
ncbi:hypothetical protein PGT21_034608 [Puccinia graminis f. sp. tritici]|uniref:Uncharacterized protein n=1 Tax=Puccinia graminis f. sp. tritici TaxID=56615 RepID=A0A5B0LM98_PUCGR|nr:hypothetical protein PGTUg99_022685 [Puccinia graminis f. sp. tritici]KAA1095018.1 hypothetical protein PGT21_034608 [Puccinia graminis f. sp. tritici]